MSFHDVLWTLLVPFAGGAAATGVTLHAVLGRRDTAAVIGWVGLAWLAPFVGPLLYFTFGINRIRRRAVALGVRGGPVGSGAKMLQEDYRVREELLEASPNLRGLVRLGWRLTQRPVLPGNEVHALVNGDEVFPAMLEAIGTATRSVSLATYIFDSDPVGEQFLRGLAAAHDRGLAVRVLIDHVGSHYSDTSMVERLERARVPVTTFLPTRAPRFVPYANLRNHRKILVVDGQIGFTGGMNIRAGHWLARDPADPIQDVHFRLEGPVVADLQRTFAIDWAFAMGETLEGETWFPELGRAGNIAARGIPHGPDEDFGHLSAVIACALSVAAHRVAIVSPYFLPDAPLIAALTVAALRGVEVDIVIPAKNNIRVMTWATSAALAPLLEAGCRVHYSAPPFDHAKLMVVDDVWSLIGSSNWDVRSLRLNFEFSVECYGRGLAQRLRALADEKIESGREVTLADLDGRSPLAKIRDGLARLGTPYL